jgi:hypothetical protein
LFALFAFEAFVAFVHVSLVKGSGAGRWNIEVLLVELKDVRSLL